MTQALALLGGGIIGGVEMRNSNEIIIKKTIASIAEDLEIEIHFLNIDDYKNFSVDYDQDAYWFEYKCSLYTSYFLHNGQYDKRDRDEYSCVKWAYREPIFTFASYDDDELNEDNKYFDGDNLLAMAEIHNNVLSKLYDIVREHKENKQINKPFRFGSSLIWTPPE